MRLLTLLEVFSLISRCNYCIVFCFVVYVGRSLTEWLRSVL